MKIARQLFRICQTLAVSTGVPSLIKCFRLSHICEGNIAPKRRRQPVLGSGRTAASGLQPSKPSRLQHLSFFRFTITDMVQVDCGRAKIHNELLDLFSRCWRRDTSYDPEHWSPQNPAWGQCAVTALIIQDLLGGALLRAQINGIEHYWNQLPEFELDITRQQFRHVKTATAAQELSREFVLSFADTVRRYHRLQKLVGEALTKKSQKPGRSYKSGADYKGFLRP